MTSGGEGGVRGSIGKGYACGKWTVMNVRVLIDEGGAVVDLVVDDHVKVLLGVVSANLLEGEFLCVGHGCKVL